MSKMKRYTEIECDDCGEHHPFAVIDDKGHLALPTGWTWTWSFCNWGPGITWGPKCESCFDETHKSQRKPPTKKDLAKAKSRVGEYARQPEDFE